MRYFTEMNRYEMDAEPSNLTGKNGCKFGGNGVRRSQRLAYWRPRPQQEKRWKCVVEHLKTKLLFQKPSKSQLKRSWATTHFLALIWRISQPNPIYKSHWVLALSFLVSERTDIPIHYLSQDSTVRPSVDADKDHRQVFTLSGGISRLVVNHDSCVLW